MSRSLRVALAALPVALIGVAGCAVTPPDRCLDMCQAAESLYGACLEDWGLGWEATTYADGQEFLGSCETWAWEMTQLHERALRDGSSEDARWLQRTCTERHQAMSAPDAPCEAFTGVDWNAVPWSQASQ